MKRKMLLLSLSVLLVLVFASGVVYGYNQSPILAKKVANGELEPVDQRLPENPAVVEVRDRIGEYGGSWLQLIASHGSTKLMTAYTAIDLFRFGPDLQPMPDLAYKYEMSHDLKTYTFYLRKGLRWSDGAPFTADDILFQYQVTQNEEHFPTPPGWFSVGDEQGVVKKIDDYTVQISFNIPAPNFIESICSNRHKLFAPAHYLKQFHKDFADPEELVKLVQESEFDSWVDLYEVKSDEDSYRNHNPELPTMNPWVPTVEPPAERFVFKRNPYFYKVDEEGNQLPYIDEVVMKLVSDPEVVNIQTAAGVPDFQSRRLTIENYTLFKTNEKKGNYKVLLWPNANTAEPAIFPNQNVKDPVMRELIQNVKFRRALSLGINREQINQVVYKGFGTAMQYTVPESSKFYKDEYARAYAEYDLERANQLLDEIGLKERDAQNYRLMKNGERLHITIFNTGEEVNETSILELIKDDWKKLGIDLSVKSLERTLFQLRIENGESAFAAWPAGFHPAGYEYLVPINNGSLQAPQWGIWFNTDGENGIEPPEKVKKIMDAFEKMQTATEEEEQELWDKILKSQAENLWVIGTVGQIPNALVKKNYFYNVPEKSMFAWGWGCYYGPTEPCQFFIDKK